MVVGILTGSGTYALPELADARMEKVDTPWGAVEVARGRFAGHQIAHVSRHGEGHLRLSNHVNHRANVWALKTIGAACAVGCTACGAVDPGVALGGLMFFDDLHFLVNRLPDGSICTFYTEPGDPRRGHWIFERPYCEPLRRALVDAAAQAGVEGRDGGCYGHVDGPRFNTRAEIAGLAAAGVTAVSQTGGPETVLAAEAELPYALMGFATDYACGVKEEPTPVDDLVRLMGQSSTRFGAVLAAALPRLEEVALKAPGVVYRFEQ